jgi:hypothetical protein
MFAEFALQPEALATWPEFCFLVSQFGCKKGRLISRYPRRWTRLVREAAQEKAGETEFLRIVESLEDIDRLLVRRVHEWDAEKDWMSNAMVEHQKRPFHAIVGKDTPEVEHLINVDSIDPLGSNSPDRWAIELSPQIRRTAAEMGKCVGPLLLHCKTIAFIDPHFDPANKRHTQPLKEFLRLIRSRNPQFALPLALEYHTSSKNGDKGKFEADLNKWIKPSLDASMKLTVVRWELEEMHNRYIVTDQAAVMFGNGLDEDSNEPQGFDTVSLLDDTTRAELLEDYSANSTKLTWLGDTIEISG